MSERADQIVLEYLRRVADAAHGVLRSDERLDFLARLRRRIDDMRVRQRADKPAQVQRIIARFGDPDALVEQERLRLAAERPEDPRFADQARRESRQTTMLRDSSSSDEEDEEDEEETARQPHPGRAIGAGGAATTANAAARAGRAGAGRTTAGGTGARSAAGPASRTDAGRAGAGQGSWTGTGRQGAARRRGSGARGDAEGGVPGATIVPRSPGERSPNETQPIPVLGPAEYAEARGAEYAYVADYSDDADDLADDLADDPMDTTGGAADACADGAATGTSARGTGSATSTGDAGGSDGTSRDTDDTPAPRGGGGRTPSRAGATGTRSAYPRRAAPSDVWTVSGRALPGAAASRRRSDYLDLAQRNKLAAVAIVLVGFGALALPVPLWLAGVALLIVARPWTMGDRLLAVALPIVTVAVYGLATDQASAVLNMSAYTPGGSGAPRLAFGIGGLIAAAYLAVRLSRTARR